MTAPTWQDTKAYLGPDTSATDDEIESAFNAESRAQWRRCRIPQPRGVSVDAAVGSAVATVTAGVTDTFRASDVGATVTGAGWTGATILTVDSPTQVTMDVPAATTGTAVVLTVDPDRSDLDDALNRRVAHSLALRGLPLGLQVSMTEAAVSTRSVGGLDAEVARLEGPYRRRVIG